MATIATTRWSAALARAVSRAVALSVYPGELLHGESPSAALASMAVAVLAIAEGRPMPSLGSERWVNRTSTLSRVLRRALFEERASGLLTDADALHLLDALDRIEVEAAADVASRFADQLGSAHAMDLLAEVAHDLRSPIGSLLLLVDRMRRGHAGPVTPIQERQLGLVYAAAFGLGALTSDVMELARGGAQLVGKEPIPFSICEAMRTVREMVQPIAEEKGLTLSTSVPTPDARLGHPAALYRVLLNLATNALKYTNEGSVEILAESKSEHVVEFCVRDTGRGIPPSVLANLYEVFRRRERPGDYSFSSTGLGLAICHKLVAAMGSSLQVQSTPDAGSTFSFCLILPPATVR